MRTRILAALVGLAGALAIGSPAHAKGPQSATVSGPGLAAPVMLRQSDGLEGRRLNDLTGAMRVYWITLRNPIERSTPTFHLGAAYPVTFDLGCDATVESGQTECARAELRLVAHPFAEGGPVVTVPAGQPVVDAAGWVRAEPGLAAVMVDIGVPRPAAPSPAASESTPADRGVSGIVVAVLAVLLGLLFVGIRRRYRIG